jgi:hypothetical protein
MTSGRESRHVRDGLVGLRGVGERCGRERDQQARPADERDGLVGTRERCARERDQDERDGGTGGCVRPAGEKERLAGVHTRERPVSRRGKDERERTSG